MPYNKGMENDSKTRYSFLKSMYYAAPLSQPDFDELKRLAKRYNRKFYDYLENDETVRQ